MKMKEKRRAKVIVTAISATCALAAVLLVAKSGTDNTIYRADAAEISSGRAVSIESVKNLGGDAGTIPDDGASVTSEEEQERIVAALDKADELSLAVSRTGSGIHGDSYGGVGGSSSVFDSMGGIMGDGSSWYKVLNGSDDGKALFDGVVMYLDNKGNVVDVEQP